MDLCPEYDAQIVSRGFANGGSVMLIYVGTESLQCFSGFLRTNGMLCLGCRSGKCECCVEIYWKEICKKKRERQKKVFAAYQHCWPLRPQGSLVVTLGRIQVQEPKDVIYTIYKKYICISTVTLNSIQLWIWLWIKVNS